MAIPRQRIHLPARAWRSALGALLRGDLFDGPEIEKFEKAFAAYIGVPDAVAVPSGRAGLRFIFDGLGIKPGAEIICSAFGYPIVPYLIKSREFNLKFADCEMQTLGLDPAGLERIISKNTAAVVATHLYGIPCHIQRILEICKAHEALLIEDCAHCFGAAVGPRKAGAFGDAAYFSFETSKVINTMGGGMVTVGNAAVGDRVRAAAGAEPKNNIGWLLKRLLTTTFEATVTTPVVFNAAVYPALRLAAHLATEQDRFASGYHGDEVSMAGRMGRYTNYQSRLGLQQMQSAADRDARRSANAERLISNLREYLVFQKPFDRDVSANYMLVTALVPRLREFAAQLLRSGVDTKHQYMRDCSGMFETGGRFPNAARAEREALHLPAYPELSVAQIDTIASKITGAITELGLPKRAG